MQNNYDKNQLNLHYNREERLAMMPPGARINKPKGKGFFKNNKSLGILLLNLIIICIIFPGFFIYTRITANTNPNPDFNFLLSGYIFDNNILTSLTIEKKKDSTLSSDEPLPFEATIYLSDNSDIYKKIFDFMPANSGKEIVFRASIPATNYEVQKNSIIHATIEYSDQTIKLKSQVKSER